LIEHLYLNFQKIIVTDALVVHFMVCIIGVSTTLIFNEGKPTLRVNEIRAGPLQDLERYVLTDG